MTEYIRHKKTERGTGVKLKTNFGELCILSGEYKYAHVLFIFIDVNRSKSMFYSLEQSVFPEDSARSAEMEAGLTGEIRNPSGTHIFLL